MGICGGIAAYKSAELVRLLRKQKHEVRVVMTQSARRFITPLTLQALSGNPVATKLLDADEENSMGHINLARWADKVIVAPATANIIAKFSHGLANDLLSTLYLATQVPIYIAPAMNQAMWSKAITQENIKLLSHHGVRIIAPDSGEQACGETGLGRMAEPTTICAELLGHKNTDKLQGMKVLISAGPTREPLDPIRYISNRSSGKMGYALAEAALNAGAYVTLVSGVVALTASQKVNLIKVETAKEMYQAVLSHATNHDIYIGAAAVADYSPVSFNANKIKKQGNNPVIQLQQTKDIITEVANLAGRPSFVVGFAAETENLEQYAKNKLTQKNLDMIAANWVNKAQGGFDKEENALQVYWRSGNKTLKMQHKTLLAQQLMTLITETINEKNTT